MLTLLGKGDHLPKPIDLVISKLKLLFE